MKIVVRARCPREDRASHYLPVDLVATVLDVKGDRLDGTVYYSS